MGEIREEWVKAAARALVKAQLGCDDEPCPEYMDDARAVLAVVVPLILASVADGKTGDRPNCDGES